MLIWPEPSKAHNSIAAVSADGSTVCVLTRRADRLERACRVVPRFGHASSRRSRPASSVPPIGSPLISDLARPSSEVIRLVHIRMILPELLRRVGTFDAHAAHHAHFGTVRLSLGAVSDWQRDAGVVISRIETGDQIKRKEAVSCYALPKVVRQIEIKAMARRAEVRDRRDILGDRMPAALQREQR